MPIRVNGPAGFGSMAPPPPDPRELTVPELREKLIAKLELKSGYRSMRWRLQHAFHGVDLDEDGLVSLPEWIRIVETLGQALTLREAATLFLYYDTAGGQRERRGVIEQAVVMADVLANRHGAGGDVSIFAKHGSLDRSPPPGSKSKAQLPSEPGGLFAGAAYEKEWSDNPSWANSEYAPPPPGSFIPRADRSGTGGNCSNNPSVEGGIFGAAMPPVLKPSTRTSNAPSLPGGIFAFPEADSAQFYKQKKSTNLPSVPGGIFAPSTALKRLDGPNVIVGM